MRTKRLTILAAATAAVLLGVPSGPTWASAPVRTSGATAGAAGAYLLGADRGAPAPHARLAQAEQTGTDGARRA